MFGLDWLILRSLVPGYALDLHAVRSASHFSRPELSDQLEVLGVVDVQLPRLVVLELGVVNHLEWQLFAAEAPDALYLEIRLNIQDALPCETMLSEVIESLQEPTHQVLCLVEHSAFFAELVVMEEPELVAFRIELLLEGGHTTASLVLVIDYQGLEVEEVPGAWWQLVKLFLRERAVLFHWLWLLLLSRLRLGSSLLLLDFFLWHRGELWRLHRDSAELYVAERRNKGRQADEGLEPLGHIGISLGLLVCLNQSGVRSDQKRSKK